MTCPLCSLILASSNFHQCTHCKVSFCSACITKHTTKVMFDYVQIPKAVKASGLIQ